MSAHDEAAFQERMRRVESLVRDIEESPDAVGRERSRELVQSLLELHAVGLERMIAAAQASEGGARLVEAWTRDEAVAGLMLLHGVHPVDAGPRVRDALDRLEPRLRTASARVAHVELKDGAVDVRLEVAGGPAANPGELRGLIEDALCAAAPDVAVHVSVETVEAVPQGFVPLAQLTLRRG
jgi:hypothetical protein